MDELKPCPFCGNAPNQTPNHTIICNTCHREVLPDVWQTRPIEDALQQRVEELEKQSGAHKKLACLVDKQQQETFASIRKAVKDIEAYRKTQIRQVAPDRWENTPLEVCLSEVLDILRKHGLVEDK